jgi:carbon monoxide dehydrogenase subunit G
VSIQIRETFRVAAPPEAVWDFLKTPARVVTCLPGAELTEAVDERTYRGRVKVKVGPITTSYAGTAQLEQVDDDARRMQLRGEGSEAGGAGTARLTMVGAVTPAGGASEVHVDATIDIAGRVMQYGRGLVESVSRQLFKQFATSLKGELEGGATPGGPSAPAATTGPSASAPVAPPEAAAPPPAAPTAAPATGFAAPTAPTPSAVAAAPPPAASAPARKSELRLFPLLLSALVDWIRRRFRRAPATK